MAQIISYPVATPASADYLVGSQTTTSGAPINPTKKFLLSSVVEAGLGYTTYTALLTQTGVNNPVATVLKNDIGATITWTRTAFGEFTATASSAVFTAAKTIVFLNNGIGALGNQSVRWSNPGTTTVFLDALQDGFLTNASIEIRIYT